MARKSRKRKEAVEETEDRTWLKRSKHRMMAAAIINRVPILWWCSQPKTEGRPIPGYYPCVHFESEGRIYFGFGFRHHRDEYVDMSADVRKEYRDVILSKGFKV